MRDGICLSSRGMASQAAVHILRTMGSDHIPSLPSVRTLAQDAVDCGMPDLVFLARYVRRYGIRRCLVDICGRLHWCVRYSWHMFVPKSCSSPLSPRG